MATADSIYIDLMDYWDDRFPFQIFIGGYGTGKTFSMLKAFGEGRMRLPIYLRRTDSTLNELITGKMGDTGNPYNNLNDKLDWNFGLHSITPKVAGIFHREVGDDGMPKPAGEAIGFATALTSLSKIRGMGLERSEMIFYDEFVKEKSEHKITGEFDALMRGYETVNRNREFEGRPACKLWLASNAEDIYNVILQGFGLVAEAEKMARRGQTDKYFPERHLALHLLKSNPDFIQKKSKTAIMRLMHGTPYERVGLYNEFGKNDFSAVAYRNLTGYRPIAHLDHAYIYQKKGSGEYYVSYQTAQCRGFTAKNEPDEMLFRRQVGVRLQDPYMYGSITFESYELKAFLLEHIM